MIYRSLISTIFISAIFISLGFLSLQSDVIRKDFFQSEVNWSKYAIHLKTEVDIPKIQIHQTKDYDISPVASNLGEARNIAYRSAHKKSRSRMSLAMERLILDENYTLGEYMEENPKIKSKIIEYFNEIPEHEVISYNKNKLILESNLKILGNKNLMSAFYSELGGDVIPEIQDDLPTDSFSGFIIDARGTNFQPSLFPKIQNQDGRDFFSKSIAYPVSVIELGLVSYQQNTKNSDLVKRVGKNPYMVFPMAITGKNRTNLILANDEIAKFISSSSNQKNLRLCKVVILVDELTQ